MILCGFNGEIVDPVFVLKIEVEIIEELLSGDSQFNFLTYSAKKN